jgi:hypothetical protein
MMISPEAQTPRRPKWSVFLSVLFLALAAVAVMSPFLTARRVGGVDALWYANMVRGVTDQIRAGHFPSPVGQGAFAYNGGVHPFRSAPAFPIVAATWYVITFGRLGEFTLLHLTAITSALIGTLGFYIAASKLMPGRRWASFTFAFLYLATPGWLAIAFKVEDFMSYMAFAAMPLVLYGNARTVLRSDGRGYVTLGAGLALVWMCHPPIAFLACVATLFIQAGAILSRGVDSWKGLTACAAAFLVLSAYYFASMSELPRSDEGTPMFTEVRTILGLALFFAGLGRAALKPRNLAWVSCAVMGAIAVGLGSKPWLIWIAFSTGFWLLVLIASRFTKSDCLGRHAFSALFICFLLGSAAAQLFLGPSAPGANRTALGFLATNTSSLVGLALPLPTNFYGISLHQLGWGLDLALLAGVLSLFGRRPAGAKLFFAVSFMLMVCFVRLPLVSDFLVGYFPPGFAATFGLPLALRLAPVFASFTAMAGVLWFATSTSATLDSRFAKAALAAIVLWAGFQANHFVKSGRALTSTEAATENNIRPENAALSRYAYDLVKLPSYFSNGMTDPALETRLLDDSGQIVVGPNEAARALEARSVRHVRLTCRPFIGSTWVDIQPRIAVEPGEHMLIRFEFDPNRTYNGYMLVISEHGYREYHLPDSGLEKAFGIGPTRTTVISLWNSGNETENYSLSDTNEPGNNLDTNGGLFANISISKFEPNLLPIHLESLIPYRASVSTASGGWLETFLVYLPGYRASLDGNQAPLLKSGEGLAEVRVPPGTHTVEIRFVGTTRLKVAAIISLIGWIALCALWLRRMCVGPKLGSPSAGSPHQAVC